MREVTVTERATARFSSRVQKAGDCWLWVGSLATNGYGQMSMPSGKKAGTLILVHRYSWVLHNHAIPAGRFVLHRCDVRNCVNPDHLFLGSKSDNMRDMAAKGRGCHIGYAAKTHCKRGHPFSGNNFRVSVSKSGLRQRKCRVCERARPRKKKRSLKGAGE